MLLIVEGQGVDAITQQKRIWRKKKAKDNAVGNAFKYQTEEEAMIKPGGKAQDTTFFSTSWNNGRDDRFFVMFTPQETAFASWEQ